MGLETVTATVGILGALGSVAGGIASYQTQKYNAAVARQQAEIARRNAAYQAYLIERKKRILMGSQEAAYAASGVTPEGTPLDVLAETARQAELDKLMALYAGETGASFAESRARQYESSGLSDLITGGLRGTLQAGSTILTYGQDVGWWGKGSTQVKGPGRLW
jgi:hypothetical protein